MNGWQRLAVVVYAAWMLVAPLYELGKYRGDDPLAYYGLAFGILGLFGLVVLLIAWCAVIAVRWVINGFRQS